MAHFTPEGPFSATLASLKGEGLAGGAAGVLAELLCKSPQLMGRDDTFTAGTCQENQSEMGTQKPRSVYIGDHMRNIFCKHAYAASVAMVPSRILFYRHDLGTC